VVCVIVYETFQLVIQSIEILLGQFAQTLIFKCVVFVSTQFFQLNVYKTS
jgi:hypothetical protein